MLESQLNIKKSLCTYQFCLSSRLITQIHGDDDPDGNLVKEFIKKQFFIKYKAEINSLMPNIVSMVNKNGDIRAAVGYKSADKQRLYLEQYLSLPIERLLSSKEGHDIARDQIVEVGNLACLS
ncbi:MAG: thermostable hemolysin, partial [Gammaproteobacteria bacterium]